MPALTAMKVAKASYPEGKKGPFLISDGQRLSIQIMPSGSKSWVLRFMMAGKSRMMGLGAYGDGKDGVSLATARERAAEARALIKRGIDPIDAREAATNAEKAALALSVAQTKTFREVAHEYIQAHKAGWRSPKSPTQWTSSLEAYAFPIIGNMPVAEVDADAVERVIKPIWLTINETASRLRGRIEAILDFARAKEWRTGDNPARWKESLKHRLPNLSRVRRTAHHPALPWQIVPAFIGKLQKKDGIAALALMMCILTATRSGEVRAAVWSEFDLEKKIWTIPAAKMKAGREHRIPLSEPALAILGRLQPLAAGRDSLVFPSIRKRAQLSDMALSMLVRGMNEVDEGQRMPWLASDDRPIVVHGFRSTFRDWCEEETSTPRAVSEAALAHVVESKVEAAYHRTDHFEKRRVLMELWAGHCFGAEVV
jgi:integrase